MLIAQSDYLDHLNKHSLFSGYLNAQKILPICSLYLLWCARASLQIVFTVLPLTASFGAVAMKVCSLSLRLSSRGSNCNIKQLIGGDALLIIRDHATDQYRSGLIRRFCSYSNNRDKCNTKSVHSTMASWHSGHALDSLDLGPGFEPRRSQLILLAFSSNLP